MRCLPVLILLAGCESGLSTVVHIDVAEGVATARSADAPGVLVTDAGGLATPLAALCGAPLEDEVTFSHDHGFGCLDERKGTEEVLRAWIQPAPEEWDLAAFCGLQPHAYAGLTLGPDITGAAAGDTADTAASTDTAAAVGTPGLVAEPEPTWPQAEVVATWKRDVSPCGGTLRGDLRIE
jgi:hypothetical protein